MHAGELHAQLAGAAASSSNQGGGTPVATLSTAAIVTIPWPGRLEYWADVAFTGVTAGKMILCSVAPHEDEDENDIEFLSLSAMSARAGNAIATVKLAFSELTSGPIKLNLMAV